MNLWDYGYYWSLIELTTDEFAAIPNYKLVLHENGKFA